MKRKKDIIICIVLLLVVICYTFILKKVDVQAIGPNGSVVGLATINKFVANMIGVHMTVYNITEYLGLIPILIVVFYALMGLYQLIKRKSLFKVDKGLYLLGSLYVVVILVYLFFEHFIINYRPVLIDGVLEASYPSSHTMLAICVCLSSIFINRKYYNKYNCFKVMNVISLITLLLIVIGRFVSGVHWFTDIIGGILISWLLLQVFQTINNRIQK